MIRGLGAFAIVMTALAMPAAAANTSGPCARSVDRVLSELSIPPQDIKSVSTVAQREGTERGRFTGYRAWVGLASCDGSLVIDLSSSCRVTQTYTRGQCSIPGIPGY